ncbi:MAG: transcriptional regulator [Clostridia bacterium]|nr:transcriptional regulator [Clostridia bacterium]
MLSQNQQIARVFKAFCDENRVTILQLLKDGELCACKLQEQMCIGQSTLSHHMRILCDAGVVNAQRVGKWTHYSLDPEGGKAALILLKELLNEKQA